MGVTALGYYGFEVTDLAAWRRYATEFLGLMEVAGPAGEHRYRYDERAWRIAISEGPADDLAYAGFEVADSAGLAALLARLEAIGVSAERDAALAKTRGVTELAVCKDPTGLQIELYYGAREATEHPLVSPAGVSGFVTGEQGAGHIVLYAGDIGAARRFYMEGLGFRLSDYIDMSLGPDFTLELNFLHCNPRHHTLALAPVPAPKHLNHFMIEVARMDDVGRAYDRAPRMGISIANTLGFHPNDRMFSFYAYTPSGFEVEYGWGARTIGDDWKVVRHSVTSTWGHHRQPNSA
ncbi:MAG: VOC family protein [Alphaproteobacteria bacterium]|nr:VOC family protein [Alphaproteobacteria bacterium]